MQTTPEGRMLEKLEEWTGTRSRWVGVVASRTARTLGEEGQNIVQKRDWGRVQWNGSEILGYEANEAVGRWEGGGLRKYYNGNVSWEFCVRFIATYSSINASSPASRHNRDSSVRRFTPETLSAQCASEAVRNVYALCEEITPIA